MVKLFKILLLMFVCTLQVYAQNTRQVSGKVTDGDTKQPLPGVTVVQEDTNNGTTTNAQGTFSLRVANNATLVFSFIGYKTQKVNVGTQTNVEVILEVDDKLLDEVVVIGYGIVKKSDVTGSIVSVKPEEMRKVPTSNIMESLQGRLPGVDITQNSGATGSGISITVRGNRSLTASNEPLYIVDGIQYSNIQDLNPNDIQSMELLKDAASTAIYGSRGANGVIMITTKKGGSGGTKVMANVYSGMSQNIGYPQVMSPQQYTAFRREANRTVSKWASNADDSKIFNVYEMDRIANNGGTYWPDLFLKNGSQQNYQIGVAGSTNRSNYYMSLNYFNEEGIFRKDNLDRYAFRMNLDHALSARMKAGAQTQVTYYDQNARRDPMNIANKINPLLEPYDATGGLVVYPNNGRDINPLSDEIKDNYANNTLTTRLLIAPYLEWSPIKDLTLRSNVGVNLSNARNGIYRASTTVDRNGAAPEALYSTNNFRNLTWENIANYRKETGKHRLNLTAVTSILMDRGETATAIGRNQLLAYQQYLGLGNATQEIAVRSDYRESGLQSYTGRLVYTYNDKYVLSATGRMDGSSKLSADNKWAFFPSVSGAWRIIQENFMKDAKVFSDLKLRLSYGVAGNDAISPYSTQSLLLRIPFSFDEISTPGYTFNSKIGNPNLRWELSTTKNAGLDFAILKNRLQGTLDVYDTQTTDLLMDRILPLTTGVTSITENIGKTRNQGVEFGINGFVVDRKNFRWNAGFTWYKNKEEIVELATGANDIANGWFIGYPTQAFYDYQKLGIWQTDEAAKAVIYKQLPGDIKVKDQNDDQIIDANNDRIVLGSTRPKWSSSFSSDFKIFGFDLSFQLFGRFGQMMNYEYAQIYDPQGVENSLVHDYWTPENPTNEYPRPNASRSKIGTLYFTTVQYKDGSYIKLRSATVGYNVEAPVLRKLGLSSVRLYATGKNLLTFAKVDNYDPERGGALSNPIPRLIIGGLDLSF